MDFGGWQKAGTAVDGPPGNVKIEPTFRQRHFQIDFIKRTDGTDIRPIAVVHIAHHAAIGQGIGDDVFAKIMAFGIERVKQQIGAKDINAHGGQIGFIRVGDAFQACQRRRFGLFGEGLDLPVVAALEDTQSRGHIGRNRLHRHGDVGPGFHMIVYKCTIVHVVKVIAGQNQDIFRARGLNLHQLLAHRIGCALVPPGAAGGLFGSQNLHPTIGELVPRVGALDVAVQRDRVVLGQDGDPIDAGMQAIADGNIDQAIFPCQRNGRFGPQLG